MSYFKEKKNQKVKVSVPGSCGELFQGRLGSDNLLISCPIDRYSTVTVHLKDEFRGIKANKNLTKSLLAVENFLEKAGQNELGLEFEFKSELTISKGMGSSTADITAALSSVMLLLDNKIDWKLLKEILISIEPTDSTPWPGLTLFDYKKGKIIQPLGNPPSLDILIFSEKGRINTIEFNENLNLVKDDYSFQKDSLEESLKFIKEGVQEKKPKKLAKASMISAKLHQNIYNRPYLEDLISLIEKQAGVYGLNIAHSGTVLGILIDRNRKYSELIAEIENRYNEIYYLYRTKVVGGGIRIEEKR